MTANTEKISSEDVLHIYTDGASRKNPGPSALAFIFVQNELCILEHDEFIGVKTNNQAEYIAIIKALSVAEEMTKGPIRIFSDSELIIKQLSGDYKIKIEHLRILRNEILDRVKKFSNVNFSYAPRTNKWIKKADKLCNRCLNLNT